MVNYELLTKTARHDGSMTETEKKTFRNSPEWLAHRMKVAENQDMKDYVTGEPLSDNFNCHHCVMDSSQYCNLSNPFYALNKEIHRKVHETYSRFFDDLAGWAAFKRKYGYSETMKRFYDIIENMFELNDDIESVLYQNSYEYRAVDPSDKFGNKILAEKFGYPVNSTGYLQWNSRYIPAGVPQETRAWVDWIMKFNREVDRLAILELRHVNLYSSYRNFRNNPKASVNTKRECRKELETVTEILREYDARLSGK